MGSLRTLVFMFQNNSPSFPRQEPAGAGKEPAWAGAVAQQKAREGPGPAGATRSGPFALGTVWAKTGP